ncbi:MAG: hypothetical protein AABX52_03940 [Nanoarchaeota archaeon]
MFGVSLTKIDVPSSEDMLSIHAMVQDCVQNSAAQVIEDFSATGNLLASEYEQVGDRFLAVFRTAEDVPTIEQALEMIANETAARVSVCVENIQELYLAKSFDAIAQVTLQNSTIFISVHYPVHVIHSENIQKVDTSWTAVIKYPLDLYLRAVYQFVQAVDRAESKINVVSMFTLPTDISIEDIIRGYMVIITEPVENDGTQYVFVMKP